jgi:hypothetical protein
MGRVTLAQSHNVETTLLPPSDTDRHKPTTPKEKQRIGLLREMKHCEYTEQNLAVSK